LTIQYGMLDYAFVIKQDNNMSSPNNFKYRFRYNGEWIYGNSIDSIARSISNSNSSISYAVAVTMVSKNIAPVHKSNVDQVISPANKVTKKLSIKDAVAGATSALKQIGGDTIPQEEINRRAIICSSCPKLSEISGCKSCGFGGKIVKLVNNVKQVFGFGVKIPNGLGSHFCDCCNCSLAMMLPANLIDFNESTRNDKTRPDSCWLKKKV